MTVVSEQSSQYIQIPLHLLIGSVQVDQDWDTERAIPLSPSEDAPDDLTCSFLRLSNLPNYPLDRLSRYEATLWRQAYQILFALQFLECGKPWERMRARLSPEASGTEVRQILRELPPVKPITI